MTSEYLPQDVVTYLLDLDRLLVGLPDTERRAILDDITDHIRAELDGGFPASQVLANLGSPAEVAASAFEPSPDGPGPQVAWWTPTRIAQVVASALFVAAGLLIAFLPVGTSVTEESSPDGGMTTTDVGTYTVADDLGWYGTAALALLPLLLSLGPMLLRGWWHKSTTIAAAVIAVLLSGLALASLGIFWLPAVLALITAAGLLAKKPKLPRGVTAYGPSARTHA